MNHFRYVLEKKTYLEDAILPVVSDIKLGVLELIAHGYCTYLPAIKKNTSKVI